MSYFNGERIDDFAEAKRETGPHAELKALLNAGRAFLLSLEDAELTTHPETGKEHKDVVEFKLALDRAARAVRL